MDHIVTTENSSTTNQLESTRFTINKIAGILILNARETSNNFSVIEPAKASIREDDLDSP